MRVATGSRQGPAVQRRCVSYTCSACSSRNEQLLLSVPAAEAGLVANLLAPCALCNVPTLRFGPKIIKLSNSDVTLVKTMSFWLSMCAQDNAEQYKFILIAPDSQSADLGGWRIPLANQAPTPDVLHIQAGSPSRRLHLLVISKQPAELSTACNTCAGTQSTP